MALNSNLKRARTRKYDEFYTLASDIENEMEHYRHCFRNKTIYLPCDDPSYSNFWHYFETKFHAYGLKKLIATQIKPGRSYRTDYDGRNKTSASLQFNGDFQSPECQAIMANEADIVITNPPFSLWIAFFKTLATIDKKFIIMGTIGTARCKDVRPSITNGSVFLGVNNKPMEFKVPANYSGAEPIRRVDGNGNKFVQLRNIRWFTNLPHDQRNVSLHLTAEYESNKYSVYDNYDAIEVSPYKTIPLNYDGKMGVPLTFLDAHRPNQFTIVGFDRDLPKMDGATAGEFRLNGRTKFARIVIQKT